VTFATLFQGGQSLQCYTCSPGESCNTNPASHGSLETCPSDKTVCFKEVKTNTNKDEVYERGCTKATASQTNNVPFCQAADDSDDFTDIEKCYCFQNECNGSMSLKSISIVSSMSLVAMLLFLLK